MQEEGFIDKLRDELEKECADMGSIEKMTIFEKHPEGVRKNIWVPSGCMSL